MKNPGIRAHGRHQNSTTARVKEAAFQIIRNRVDINGEWIFYDLFAGSGQMGIEALNLGAVHATFSELAPDRLSEIQRSLTALDVPRDNFTLARARANKVMQEAFEYPDIPCVVWADPPYTYNHTPSNDPAILIALYREAARLGKTLPLLIIQVHEKNAVLTQEFLAANPDLEIYRYGSNCLTVLQGSQDAI